MQRALVWLKLYGCEAIWQAQKQAKKTKKTFLAYFWAYVGQPHKHTSWATPIPFTSINSTNPRTNPWKFHEKILKIGRAGKRGIFESAILNFFCFISVEKPARSYEVSFISALWMVFPESWKRSCPNFYAHDCMFSCSM